MNDCLPDPFWPRTPVAHAATLLSWATLGGVWSRHSARAGGGSPGRGPCPCPQDTDMADTPGSIDGLTRDQ